MRRALLWCLLIALVPLSLFALRSLDAALESGSYQRDTRWSGVLRVRVHTALPAGTGSLVPWLEKRAAAFARGHRGVRVQCIDAVGESAAVAADDPLPPDAIVWSPGMLADPSGLAPLEPAAELLPGLADAVRCGGALYAAPVAMGAYFWIADADALPAAPGDPALEKEPRLACPADSPGRSWSAAFLAMFSGTVTRLGSAAALPGVDLGLPGGADEAAETEAAPYRLPSALPEDFRARDAVWEVFRDRRAEAILATQTELRRLEALSENGRSPEPSVYAGGLPFTDQIALASIPRVDRADANERARLTAEFIAWLQNEDSQAALGSVWAFRVTPGPAVYRADRPGMAAAEASLAAGVIAPNAFGNGWRDLAAFAADRLLREGGDPAAVLHEALR